MGWLGVLGKIGAGIAAPFTGGASLGAIPMIDALGAGAGAASESAASNRSERARLIAEQEILRQRQEEAYRRAVENRETDRRASGRDAFADMQRAQYLGVAQDRRTRSGRVIKGATDAERAAAMQWLAENQRRLAAQDSLLPTVEKPEPFTLPEDVMKAGALEKWLGLGGAAATAYTAAKRSKESK